MTKQMYVFLEDGDIIQEGDEIFNYMEHWATIKESIGNKVKTADVGFIRRAIDIPAQQASPDTVCAQLRQVSDVAMTTYGLTKREWFAGMALSGYLADHTVDGSCEEMAEMSFQQADAMLKEGKETE